MIFNIIFLISHVSIIVEASCIKKLEGPVTVFGAPVGALEDSTFKECGEKCIQNEECFSLAYNEWTKQCFLKDKKHTTSSPIKNKNTKWFSAYKTEDCGKGNIFQNVIADSISADIPMTV